MNHTFKKKRLKIKGLVHTNTVNPFILDACAPRSIVASVPDMLKLFAEGHQLPTVDYGRACTKLYKPIYRNHHVCLLVLELQDNDMLFYTP